MVQDGMPMRGAFARVYRLIGLGATADDHQDEIDRTPRTRSTRMISRRTGCSMRRWADAHCRRCSFELPSSMAKPPSPRRARAVPALVLLCALPAWGAAQIAPQASPPQPPYWLAPPLSGPFAAL